MKKEDIEIRFKNIEEDNDFLADELIKITEQQERLQKAIDEIITLTLIAILKIF